jgi:hypothetical protein
MKTFKPVFSTSGVVDSETKALIAFAIREGIYNMDKGRERRLVKFL